MGGDAVSRVNADSNSGPASPVSNTSTRPKRRRNTTESSLRTRRRSQSGIGGCSTSITTSPASTRCPVCSRRHAARGVARRRSAIIRSCGTGTPCHTSLGLRSSATRTAPPRWSTSPCVIASQSSRRMPNAHSAGVTTRPPTSNAPGDPPASTSSTWPLGTCTAIASPCPTSTSVTRTHPGRGSRQPVHGAVAIPTAHAAAATRAPRVTPRRPDHVIANSTIA